MKTTATSILRKDSFRQRTPASKKVVVFPKYNKAEEEDRQLRGVRLRKQLRKEKERYKKTAQYGRDRRRVYAVLLNPANHVGLSTLAIHNRSFRVQLFTVFRDIAALPNADIDIDIDPQQQVNDLDREKIFSLASEVLNALSAANLPFLNVLGSQDILDVLGMIGTLIHFSHFLNAPHVSDGSDHSDDDDKHDVDGKGDDGKKKGNGGNSIVGDERQRVA